MYLTLAALRSTHCNWLRCVNGTCIKKKNKKKQEVDSFRVLYGAQQVYHGGHGEKQQSIPALWRKYSGKPHTLTGTHCLTNRTLIKRKTARHISNPSTLTDKKQLIPRTELQHE